MSLNPSQLAVTQCRGPRTLALAGAGTGKTTTCIHWVASLIESGIPPGNILMLTFTRKAAAEMKTRVLDLCFGHPACEEITVGNYHSIANRLIRQDPQGFQLDRNFTILDEDENKSVWKAALLRVGIPKDIKTWDPTELAAITSEAINWCKDPKELLRQKFEDPSPTKPSKAEVALNIFNAYEAIKKEQNLLSFDDLLLFWLKRLESDQAWKEKLRRKFQNVLVDELQDNNSLNAAIITALAPHRLLGVGDAAQSIYAFRNANPHLIAEFQKTEGTITLPLENNYRSGQEILDIANEILTESPTALTLKAHREEKSKTRFFTCETEYEEAELILNWIERKKREGTKPPQIAILTRTRFTWQTLEGFLRRNAIAYKTYGGKPISEKKEVKNLVSFLRLDYNPKDSTSWIRAATLFPKFGEAGAQKLLQKYSPTTIPEKEWPKQLVHFREILETLKTIPKLPDKMEYVLEEAEEAMRSEHKDDWEERRKTLEGLILDTRNQGMEIEEFLEAFSIDRGDLDKTQSHPPEAIVLSTIHSAKGLEWDNVWILGAGSQQLPSPRSKTYEEREEEKRLTYVAVTRARNELNCSYPVRTKHARIPQGPSPFLETHFRKSEQ